GASHRARKGEMGLPDWTTIILGPDRLVIPFPPVGCMRQGASAAYHPGVVTGVPLAPASNHPVDASFPMEGCRHEELLGPRDHHRIPCRRWFPAYWGQVAPARCSRQHPEE